MNEIDLEKLCHNSMEDEGMPGNQFEVNKRENYLLYKDLNLQSKRVLSYSRTAPPLAKIKMLFAITLFNDGSWPAAVLSKKC